MTGFRHVIPAFILTILLITGCSDNDGTNNSDLKQMTVSFDWPKDYGKCFDPKNPEIKVSDVPEDTVYFKVKVIDIQNNDYDHGGGKVNNDKTGIIPYGTLSGYQGPCPSQAPTGTGTYDFTVIAYDANDSPIAKGSSYREFP